MEEIITPEGRVLAVHVPARLPGTAWQINGRYLKRAGDELTAMGDEELRAIFAEAGLDFSAHPCPGATVADLAPASIATFRERWVKKTRDDRRLAWNDAETLTNADSALAWRVILHHDTHTHPYLGPVTGNNIDFTAPAPEDLLAATNSYLEVELTATDNGGLTHVVTRDLNPRKVDVTLASSPAGRTLSINGASFTAPQTFVSWDAWGLQVEAPSQTVPGVQGWLFQSTRIKTAFADPASHFHHYATLTDEQAVFAARDIWHSINRPNLIENILPTRPRATLVLRKDADHAINRLRLRKL